MFPTITLGNGIRVANFSSPHPFRFVTGEVLPACPDEYTRALMLENEETLEPSPCNRWTNVGVRYRMSQNVHRALNQALDANICDVLLVPLPVMLAAKEVGHPALRIARTCRLADRVSKTIHSDRFCV